MNCQMCNKITTQHHLHDVAHGIASAHMAGSERYECGECGYAMYAEEGKAQGLTYIFDN